MKNKKAFKAFINDLKKDAEVIKGIKEFPKAFDMKVVNANNFSNIDNYFRGCVR